MNGSGADFMFTSMWNLWILQSRLYLPGPALGALLLSEPVPLFLVPDDASGSFLARAGDSENLAIWDSSAMQVYRSGSGYYFIT